MAAAVVFLPGLVLAYALRLRGLLMWGFAPAAGAAVLAVSAVALGFVGVSWSPVSASLVTLILAGIAWALMLSLRARTMTTGRRIGRWAFLAVIVGAIASATRMAIIIGAPSNVSQTNDATFHLNALRYIADTGSASSLELAGTIGGSGFYPGAWHAIASLTMQLTGADVATAANATSLALAGPVWTVSIAALAWAVTHDRRVTGFAALLAPTLFAFPFHMLDYGVLYPYALSLAILPGVLAVLVGASAEGTANAEQGRRVSQILAVIIASAVGLVGIGFAQPSVLLLWVVAVVAWALTRLFHGWKVLSLRSRWVRVGCAFVVVVTAAAFWLGMVAVSSENLWPGIRNAPDAAARMIVNGSVGPGPAIVVAVLALTGFIIAVRTTGLRWFALFAVALAALVLVAQSVQNDTVRMLLSPWYADPRRFTAMMPLVVIPFAAIAVASVAGWKRWRTARTGTAVALVLIVLAYVEFVAWSAINPIEYRYGESENSYLSVDERALLNDLDEYVEPDARVIGNPSAGAAFGYGLSGVDVVPRTWSMPTDQSFQALREDLADLTDDPAVCPAVDALGVEYVLDFGESEDGPGKWEMPGLTGFAEGDGFELVAERGDASLWRITGCE